MAKRPIPKPTDAELAILCVLWKRGPSTVREVVDALHPERGTAYNTTLKLLQIMTEKGLVRRDETHRTHIYEPVATAETTQRQLVRDIMERAFGGAVHQLILQALSARKASQAELAEIRQMIDEMERHAK